MLGEATVAAVVGLAVLFLVLEPVIWPKAPRRIPADLDEVDESPKGLALAALREIEFDRATGKLSEADYEALAAKYTAKAVEALRGESLVGGRAPDAIEAIVAAKVQALRTAGGEALAPACARCGPRPEPDALFCSSCGVRLAGMGACPSCGARLRPDGQYCEACGTRVAA